MRAVDISAVFDVENVDGIAKLDHSGGYGVPHPGALFGYSPMWDIHLATWTAAAVTAGENVRQTDFPAALKQVTNGLATGFPPVLRSVQADSSSTAR